MLRRALALALVASVAAGCNDYSFSPVGRCLIQPGSVSVKLSDVSSADVLFVVDDSPSMDPKQAGLAASFKDFITRMVQTNTTRARKGLAAIDFQIAVTTSSIFYATAQPTRCVAGAGGNQCCRASSCTDVAACTPGTGEGCGAGQTCVITPTLDADGIRVVGEQAQCCAMSSCAAAPSPCVPGDHCSVKTTGYANPPPSSSFCTPGAGTPGTPFPSGALVAPAPNPQILKFDKALDWASWGTASPDPALTQLVQQFEQNIRVGSCGSGQEQGLEAGRLAIQKALAGEQPGIAAGSWPRPGAKLVVVWVADEDDCSNRASAPLAMMASTPGADSCVWDKHRPDGQQRQLPVTEYADFFASLVRPGGAADLGAAFIVSSARCSDGSYAAADACSGTASCPVQPPLVCQAEPVCGGAYAAGERFLSLATAFKARGFGVVEGTVCDAYPPKTFGPVLSAIADLVKPVEALKLPSRPAARAVTQVRIADNAGATRKTCQAGVDWCFVDCADSNPTPVCLEGDTSECIYIDHERGSCEANPGESYAAEYLGMIPPSGCADESDCVRSLGGKSTDWACHKEPGQRRGSCGCTDQ